LVAKPATYLKAAMDTHLFRDRNKKAEI